MGMQDGDGGKKKASKKQARPAKKAASKRSRVTKKPPLASPPAPTVREPVTPPPVEEKWVPTPVTKGGDKVPQRTGRRHEWSVVFVIVAVLALLGAALLYGGYLQARADAAQPVDASIAEVQPTATSVEVTLVVTHEVIITATPAATDEPSQSAPAAKEGVADVPEVSGHETQGTWDVTFYEGATDQMHQWVDDLDNLVTNWSLFPNVDYVTYGFKSKDGVEYGMAESAYCQRDQTCDVNVPARHYRLVTGDYNIPGIDHCSRDADKAGCGIALFNVGEITAMFRESMVDYGFTVAGSYFNGEAMPVTIRALLSNTAYNMLNVKGDVNMGANCSLATGCDRVRLTFVVLSGNQVLVKGTTFVSR